MYDGFLITSRECTMTTLSAVRRTRSAAHKFLTVQLAHEHYGMPVLKVQEIIGMLEVTPVPRMPPEVRGVINLRGRVIPVIELRIRFGMPPVPDTKRTCIVVLTSGSVGLSEGQQPTVIGVIVDQVSEVLDIPPDQIEPPPPLGTSIDLACLSGMAKTAKGVVMMLDIERVLAIASRATP
jgi:purine-binding chemotaxis protein CheW